ncbi:MAG: response regulator [Deltaproteobacteria bacterium]|nr:response regulator [Deltaproteobacteria bacterium]
MQILVVDDYEPFARSLRNLLGDEHAVTIALTRERAVELLGHGVAYDLVLLDVNLAGVSGIEVYEFLKARGSASRVVFMTGGIDDSALAEALARIDAPQLEKPFREGELRALLTRWKTT